MAAHTSEATENFRGRKCNVQEETDCSVGEFLAQELRY